MRLVPGMTYVDGRARTVSSRLLAAAENLGYDHRVVRTQDSGFIVPDAVADEYQRLCLPEWSAKEAVF